MISHTENPKDATRKLFELINILGKAAWYKKSLALQYENERSEREIKKTIPFTTASKIIKYLGTNLPKEVEDLKATWYWWKKTETDGKTHHVLGLGETMLWKWLHHPIQIEGNL